MGDLLVQLDADNQALIVTAVHLVDVASNGGGDDAMDAINAILGMIQLGDIDQSGDGRLGGGWDADRMQSAVEETALNLHDLGVYLAGDVVASRKVHVLGIEGLKVGQVLDILVKVASPGGRQDGVDKGRPASLVLTQPLVGRDELLLLQSLVKTSVLGGGGEVGHGGRVGPTFGDGRL